MIPASYDIIIIAKSGKSGTSLVGAIPQGFFYALKEVK